MVQNKESSLGMFTSLMMSLVATTFPNPLIGTTSIMVFAVISIPYETPTMMTTSFIWQQIDLQIHDIKYHLSGQLAEIVQPMVQNKMQQLIQGIGSKKDTCWWEFCFFSA